MTRDRIIEIIEASDSSDKVGKAFDYIIFPFYLPKIFPFDMRFLRILRLTKIFRLFKLSRYTNALNNIGKVIKSKKEELLSTMFIMLLVIFISASLIYYIETKVQPELFPDIGAVIWWVIVTLTTVGYGDIYFCNQQGKSFSRCYFFSRHWHCRPSHRRHQLRFHRRGQQQEGEKVLSTLWKNSE